MSSTANPALAPERRAYAYCAACPKLCRFSCPVSEADRSETVTPWGKMVVGHQALLGARPLDAEGLDAAYACSDCGRCTENCVHRNQVAPSLIALRAEGVRQGLTPEPVKRLRQRYRETGGPFGTSLPAAAERAGGSARGPYFPGCTALVKEPSLVADAQRAGRAVGLDLGLSPLSARCCGYPLYAAGLHEAFAEHAQAFSRASGESLVVGDPGCAYTFSVIYPKMGLAAPAVKLWVDEMARHLSPDAKGKAVAIDASYHDPCHLGRGLGRYEAPRQLLATALGGRPAAEAAESRRDSGCSGGGGALPRTRPRTAQEMAGRQAQELGAGRTVVTACPAARRMFEKAGAEALSLETVLARFLCGDSP